VARSSRLTHHAVAIDSHFGKLPPDQILSSLPRGVWFSSVGEPLDEAERSECATYLTGLGLRGFVTIAASGWQQSRDIANSPVWSRDWWNAERAAERTLFDLAASKYGAEAILMRLTNLMEGSGELFHGPASVACTRAGIADPSLARSAAGAASHSLHQYGLASLAEQGEQHLFAAKFRLFLAGRWPLCVNESSFYVF
jgi:hypothetical protein